MAAIEIRELGRLADGRFEVGVRFGGAATGSLRQQLEAGAVPRPDLPEMPVVKGDQEVGLEPFGESDHRGVGTAERKVGVAFDEIRSMSSAHRSERMSSNPSAASEESWKSPAQGIERRFSAGAPRPWTMSSQTTSEKVVLRRRASASTVAARSSGNTIVAWVTTSW
jgi:hypothetical protein